MKVKQIKTIGHLRRTIASGHQDFRLYLQGGLFSRKTITLAARGRFHIVNHIDESIQTLSEKQLSTASNVGKAIQKGSLVVLP